MSQKDEFGYKRGALGKFDPSLKLKRGSFPNSRAGTDQRGVGKYTSDDSGLTRATSDDAKFVTEERMTNDAAKDIYDNVVKNSLDDDAGGSRPGPIKYGVD
jgi:hypothetical protein